MDLSQDLEHYSRILAGCESAYHHANSNTDMTPDGKYAFAVLSLHAGDAGIHAGQEGFMDSIKKGATKAKDWIMKILKAIREWLGGTFKITIEIVKKNSDKEINAAASTTLINPLKNLARVYKGFTDANQEKHLSSNDILITIKAIDTVVEELEKDGAAKASVVWPNLLKVLKNLEDDSDDLADKAEKAANSLPSLDSEDYNERSKTAMTIASMSKDLVSAGNSVTSAIDRMENKLDKKEE